MGKGAIFIGIVILLISIFGAFKVLTTNTPIFVAFYPVVGIIIGVALIILYKEEDKIEQRKDIKNKKSK